MANRFKNATAPGITAETTVYTCPSNTTSLIHSLFSTNTDGSAQTTTVKITDSSEAQSVLLRNDISIPAGDALEIRNQITLEENDSVSVIGSGVGFDVFLSILEIT